MPVKSFLDVSEGQAIAFRLSRAQWDSLPYLDEARAPKHLDVFRDRERLGVVYRWLGGPRSGSWWMAKVAIDDGLAPPPRRPRLHQWLRSALAARRPRK